MRSSEEKAVNLLANLGVSAGSVVDFMQFYNSDLAAYGNEVYAEVETRVVHWLNFLSDGWFNQRLDAYLRQADQFDLVVDLGFSVPYIYLRDDFRARVKFSGSQFLFVDSQENAAEFYDALVKAYELDFEEARDSVVIADIENASTHDDILRHASSKNPQSVLVVMSEVLEHLDEPGVALSLARDLLQLGQEGDSLLYTTLPIGYQIPSHLYEFLTVESARHWLGEFVDIVDEKVVRPEAGVKVSQHLQSCYCSFSRVKDKGV